MTEEQKQKLRNIKRKTLRKVLCVETGIVFDKIVDAAKSVNCTPTAIGIACRGVRGIKIIKGYHWKYVEPEYE